MSPELAAVLQPHLDRIRQAQNALDTANRADTNPLDALAPAGHLIGIQADLIRRCIDLLNYVGTTPTEVEVLRMQGRIRAAEALARS